MKFYDLEHEEGYDGELHAYMERCPKGDYVGSSELKAILDKLQTEAMEEEPNDYDRRNHAFCDLVMEKIYDLL